MANGNYNQQGDRPRPQQQRDYRDATPVTVAGKPLAQWKTDIQKWIKDGIAKETIIYAEAMGRTLKDEGLTTSQIRNVFGEMRKIQMNGFSEEVGNFLLLRPKLAYAVKRQNAKGMESFYNLFCDAYDAVDTTDMSVAPRQFDHLLQVMEAVLAYHKYYGGQ